MSAALIAGPLLAVGLSACRSTDEKANPFVGSVDGGNYDLEEIQERARRGEVYFQRMLAATYRYGIGVSKNPAHAYEWEMRAAEQKNVDAYYEVGKHLLYGEGVRANDAQAFEWFKRAADEGHLPATRQVGMMYLDGEGVEQNVREGRRYLRMAADKGDEEAKRFLLERFGERTL